MDRIEFVLRQVPPFRLDLTAWALYSFESLLAEQGGVLAPKGLVPVESTRRFRRRLRFSPFYRGRCLLCD